MAKLNGSALKWIAKNSRPVIPAIALLTAMGAAAAYISVEFAIASMGLLDAAMGKSDLGFAESIIRIIVLLVVQLLLDVAYTLCDIRVRAVFKNTLQIRLFQTILTRDYSGVSKLHSGELLNRLTSDVDAVNTNTVDIIPSTVTLLCSVIFGFSAMFRLDSMLALICLALGPVVLAAAALYGRKMKGLYKKCRQSDGRTRSFMQECIQNIIAVKAFCGEKRTASITSLLQRENYRLNMKRARVNVIVNILYYVAITAAYYFAVAWCAYKIKLGIMTVGAFTAIVQLVSSVQSPFKDIAGVIPKFYAGCASAERIMEIERIDDDTISENAAKRVCGNDFTSIVAEGLSFSYDGEPVLENACIEIMRGETAVIHGTSGIGKSTFFKLVLGILKPSRGSVEICFPGKKAAAGAGTRHLFAYVPQGNMIISGSIRSNIIFPCGEEDEERVIEAARLACIWDYIASLPDGLDTVIGENGLGLSEGQVQRIAIARALYCGAPVILLDEATSALDEATELKILSNIRNLKDKTCIIITHRPGALEICDKKIHLTDNKFILE